MFCMCVCVYEYAINKPLLVSLPSYLRVYLWKTLNVFVVYLHLHYIFPFCSSKRLYQFSFSNDVKAFPGPRTLINT